VIITYVTKNPCNHSRLTSPKIFRYENHSMLLGSDFLFVWLNFFTFGDNCFVGHWKRLGRWLNIPGLDENSLQKYRKMVVYCTLTYYICVWTYECVNSGSQFSVVQAPPSTRVWPIVTFLFIPRGCSTTLRVAWGHVLLTLCVLGTYHHRGAASEWCVFVRLIFIHRSLRTLDAQKLMIAAASLHVNAVWDLAT